MLSHIFLTFALLQTIGPFIFDFDHTHVYNPKWSPHARFHNGQTISTGVCLGMAAVAWNA